MLTNYTKVSLRELIHKLKKKFRNWSEVCKTLWLITLIKLRKYMVILDSQNRCFESNIRLYEKSKCIIYNQTFLMRSMIFLSLVILVCLLFERNATNICLIHFAVLSKFLGSFWRFIIQSFKWSCYSTQFLAPLRLNSG